MRLVIYLDHNATTSVLPAVLEGMMPYLTPAFGHWVSAARPNIFSCGLAML